MQTPKEEAAVRTAWRQVERAYMWAMVLLSPHGPRHGAFFPIKFILEIMCFVCSDALFRRAAGLSVMM